MNQGHSKVNFFKPEKPERLKKRMGLFHEEQSGRIAYLVM
jgi:hypothetical protein